MSLIRQQVLPQQLEVPPDGSLSAKLAFIGQAPASKEVEKGKPFVGRAGGVLQGCMHSVGLIRPEVYMTNLIKIELEGNKVTPYVHKGSFTAKGEYWRDRLREELRKTTANVLVPMGNEATLALCGIESITKWRGSILDSTLLPGRKVIPTIHPASTLYGNFLARYYIVEDLKRAVVESDYPEIRLPKRNYIIKPTVEQSIAYVNKLNSAQTVAFDIEVTSNEVSCISFSADEMEAISIPIMHFSPTSEKLTWLAIANLLGNEKVEKVGQNVIFDTQFLLSHNKIRTRGTLHDTMIAGSILYPDFPKGLDFLVSFHLKGEPYYKDEGKQWKSVKNWDQFWTYNAKDAALTLAVWNVLKYQIMEEGYKEAYDNTMQLLDPLNFMVYRGIAVDKEAIERNKIVVQKNIDETQEKLDTMVGKPLNVNSPKQCRAYFYDDLGIKPFMKWDKKAGESKITLDDGSLQRLVKGSITRPPIPAAKLVQDIRGQRKLMGTYLEITFDKDHRFRCSYNMRGTTTGRLSSSKTIAGTGMNHQNLPRSFREYLVPDPGYIFIDWDKRQAEWVVVAYLSGDENMIRVIEENLDAHVITGMMISNLPEEYIVREHKLIGSEKDPGVIEDIREKMDRDYPHWNRESLLEQYLDAFWPRTYSIRSVGKHSNHGFNYDMTAGRFMDEYETTLQEAIIIHQRYFQGYPGIRKWHQEVQDQLKIDRTLRTSFDRKRRFLEEWSDDLFKSAYDFNPQGTVVELVLRGMIRMYYDSAPWMKPLELMLQSHDGILGQYPISTAATLTKVIQRGRDLLDEPLYARGREYHIETDVKIGFNWRDMIELDCSVPNDQLEAEVAKTVKEAEQATIA